MCERRYGDMHVWKPSERWSCGCVCVSFGRVLCWMPHGSVNLIPANSTPILPAELIRGKAGWEGFGAFNCTLSSDTHVQYVWEKGWRRSPIESFSMDLGVCGCVFAVHAPCVIAVLRWIYTLWVWTRLTGECDEKFKCVSPHTDTHNPHAPSDNQTMCAELPTKLICMYLIRGVVEDVFRLCTCEKVTTIQTILNYKSCIQNRNYVYVIKCQK